jgi:predicted RNA binding protein YcfA (HicA-like mRNA interferase family)
MESLAYPSLVSRREKALTRLKSKPKDFTWEELLALMAACGYELKRTGGSGRKFVHISTGTVMYMHQPHPSNVLKAYQVREAIDELTEKGFL